MGQDLREPVVVVQLALPASAFGHPVGHAEQRLTWPEEERVGRELGALVDAQQHLGLHDGSTSPSAVSFSGGVARAGDGAAGPAPLRVGFQFPVDEAQEARLCALPPDGDGLGALLRHGGVQPAEDGFDTVPLPGQQPHQMAGQPGDGHGFGVLALHVAEQEAPPVVPHGEEVVEVPADGLPLPCGS